MEASTQVTGSRLLTSTGKQGSRLKVRPFPFLFGRHAEMSGNMRRLTTALGPHKQT